MHVCFSRVRFGFFSYLLTNWLGTTPWDDLFLSYGWLNLKSINQIFQWLFAVLDPRQNSVFEWKAEISFIFAYWVAHKDQAAGHPESKQMSQYSSPISQMLTDFQNSFIFRPSSKTVLNSLFTVLLHLKDVATILCEIFGNFLMHWPIAQSLYFQCSCYITPNGVSIHLTCVGSDGSSASLRAAEKKPLISSARLSSGDVQTSSHFMPYFITVTVIVVMLYVLYHKRNLVTKYQNFKKSLFTAGD